MNIANFLRTPVLKNFCVWLLLKKAMWIALSSGKISPAGNYMIKVNNRNTRTRCEICSKLTTQQRHSGIFIVNSEHISTMSNMYVLHVFSCEYWEIYKTSFFCRTSLAAAPEVVSRHKLLSFKPSFFSLFSLILKCSEF